MKKLTILFAAFLLGLFVSITIHACGGDKAETEISGGNGDNGSAGSAAGPKDMWDYGSGKITKSYTYDEDGKEWLSTEWMYDSQKRPIGYKIYHTSSTQPNMQGKLLWEYKNYVYSGNSCTYDDYSYDYDYQTGALTGTTITKYKEEYLQ